MGVLRGDPWKAFHVPRFLVVSGLTQDSILPFRQFAGADVPDLFSLRAGRQPEPHPLSQGGGDQPFCAHRHRGSRVARHCLGRFRRQGGPVFRHTVLGGRQQGILRGARAAAPARPRPLLRGPFGRIQAAYLQRTLRYLAGLAGGDEFRLEGPVHGPGLRDRLGADIFPFL